MTLKDKLIAYTFRKVNSLEEEREEMRRILRRQPLDSLDLYEIMRMDIRNETWREFINDLYSILIYCDRDKK